MMESAEAIMENENNSNLESQSINRDRDQGQDVSWGGSDETAQPELDRPINQSADHENSGEKAPVSDEVMDPQEKSDNLCPSSADAPLDTAEAVSNENQSFAGQSVNAPTGSATLDDTTSRDIIEQVEKVNSGITPSSSANQETVESEMAVTFPSDAALEDQESSASIHIEALPSNTRTGNQEVIMSMVRDDEGTSQSNIVTEAQEATLSDIVTEDLEASQSNVTENQEVSLSNIVTEDHLASQADIVTEDQEASQSDIVTEDQEASQSDIVTEDQEASQSVIVTEDQEASQSDIVTEDQEASQSDIVTEDQEGSKSNIVTEDQEASQSDIVTEDQEGSQSNIVTEDQEDSQSDIVTEDQETSQSDIVTEYQEASLSNMDTENQEVSLSNIVSEDHEASTSNMVTEDQEASISNVAMEYQETSNSAMEEEASQSNVANDEAPLSNVAKDEEAPLSNVAKGEEASLLDNIRQDQEASSVEVGDSHGQNELEDQDASSVGVGDSQNELMDTKEVTDYKDGDCEILKDNLKGHTVIDEIKNMPEDQNRGIISMNSFEQQDLKEVHSPDLLKDEKSENNWSLAQGTPGEESPKKDSSTCDVKMEISKEDAVSGDCTIASKEDEVNQKQNGLTGEEGRKGEKKSDGGSEVKAGEQTSCVGIDQMTKNSSHMDVDELTPDVGLDKDKKLEDAEMADMGVKEIKLSEKKSPKEVFKNTSESVSDQLQVDKCNTDLSEANNVCLGDVDSIPEPMDCSENNEKSQENLGSQNVDENSQPAGEQNGDISNKSSENTVVENTNIVTENVDIGGMQTQSSENIVSKSPVARSGSPEPAHFIEKDTNDDAKDDADVAILNEDLIEVRNIKKEMLDDTAMDGDGTSLNSTTEMIHNIKKELSAHNQSNVRDESNEDMVVLDDDGQSFPVKKEPSHSVPVISSITGQELQLSNSGPVIASVSGREHQLHDQAAATPAKKATTAGDAGSANVAGGKGTAKKSKPKNQTCIVCLKVCRCKYNIVRNGDVKHLCGDDCFKRFRKSPSQFLKKDGKPEAPNKTKQTPETSSDIKTCTVCQLMQINLSQPFCNWKGLDFCGESCLGKFQANLSTNCSFCQAYIPMDMRAAFCLKIGNDMRPFCQQRCYNEFKKKLQLCACCQRDLSSIPGSFSAMVGSLDKKIRQFCSQACRQRLEAQIVDVEVLSMGVTGKQKTALALKAPVVTSTSESNKQFLCSVCQKIQTILHTIRFQGKVVQLCSDLCLSAFQYTNKIGWSKCDYCSTLCTAEEVQAHFVQFEGNIKRFCSDTCVIQFRRERSKQVSCAWCLTKKLNFDMIERLDAGNKFQMFCSLNCLSLYRVNLQAKSNQAVSCDQCKRVAPAQYHLTMSDASVRNFCSYGCVMTFQAQFTNKTLPPAKPLIPATACLPTITSKPQGPDSGSGPRQTKESSAKSRMSTRQVSKQQSPSFPVISSVMSLASQDAAQAADKALPTPSPVAPSPQSAPPASPSNTLSSGDGKHQIIIQAPPMKLMKNKTLQCRPATMTKATSCRPHAQIKETQTEKVPDKQVFVPVPVPVYIPMPTVMYSAPTPVPVPFPVPIPVPIFIPTTRKSTTGIFKSIKEIVERLPSDPLEAELLMMAEAVAYDKAESDSESDTEANDGEDFDGTTAQPGLTDETESSKKRDAGAGEEDMIQMALRMAEEMSSPIEDLERNVEPVAVNAEPPRQVQPPPVVEQSYDNNVDEDYIPPGARSRGRPQKRASRGRPASTRPKRQRVEKSYVEEQEPEPPAQVPPQQLEPAADANYRLKFTYGVNAWRHWIVAKNAQIENSQKMGTPSRMRTFPTDILKCTTDQLNFSLICFIKEVRKPNGEEYSADSIFYLCLGIQQYLYENGRIDSIFTDMYFDKFSDSLHEILKNLQPKVNAQGQMLCRIEEEHLWESKQLGAHSPFVLLNTLIYFHTKYFVLKTAQDHMSLSFAQILKHWKKGVPAKGQASMGKNISLRFYCLANGRKETPGVRKNSRETVPVYEITENFENPLRCPVKLYEFFLSKCPESIKNRNDIFYPVPERSCVPDSPVWYSTQSIDHHSMDRMLTRILLVREIQEAHLHAQPVFV